MQATTILVFVGGLLFAAAAFKSVRSRRIDLQSRIWLLTAVILFAVSAWLLSRH